MNRILAHGGVADARASNNSAKQVSCVEDHDEQEAHFRALIRNAQETNRYAVDEKLHIRTLPPVEGGPVVQRAYRKTGQ